MYYLTTYKKIRAKKATDFNNLVQQLSALKNVQKEQYHTKKLTYKNREKLIIKDRSVIQGLEKTNAFLRQMIHIYPQETKKNNFHIFQIPKASGGFRTIKAPNDNLKTAYSNLRYMLEFDVKALSHDAAYAYVRERSTTSALKVHQANESAWFLKVDIEGFFDHCDAETIEKQLLTIHPFYHNPELCKNLADFATLDNGLPQGTPLSPLLTNIIMIPFDFHMEKYCQERGLIYTRYADDILVSSKESFKFTLVTDKIQNLFEHLSFPFQIKKAKTRYGNRNGRNWNLGLMLNKDNDITLGHQFKRDIKVILHKYYLGQLPKNDLHYLGLIAYLKQIEPTYYQGLDDYCMRKYRRRIKVLTT